MKCTNSKLKCESAFFPNKSGNLIARHLFSRIKALNNKLILILISLSFLSTSCMQDKHAKSKINAGMFQHHYITQDLPGEAWSGYGCPTLADFDNDGDLDYSFSEKKNLYWFENTGITGWEMHDVGALSITTLGANVMDVNKDGWPDIVIGGYWFSNSKEPSTKNFTKYQYDDRIKSEIHDIVIKDIDGDGINDVLVLGDKEGLFWYKVPENACRNNNWERTIITLDVLKENEHIHAGFFPNGVGDLDGDGDNDIVLPDRWLENNSNGLEWKKHQLPFGKRGRYGLSSRSWIIDLDKDGDQDIVMTDCDQQASRIAWLESSGGATPTFITHFLPMSALGIRGSFHTLFVGDMDNDGDKDILTCDQEDDSLLPEGANPRWYIWENVSEGTHIRFVEKVILDMKLGGHDALVGDADGDGDLDIFSKVWHLWTESANNGVEHGDYIENLLK